MAGAASTQDAFVQAIELLAILGALQAFRRERRNAGEPIAAINVHRIRQATWEVLIGYIVALALMQLLNTPRRIVEIWLYIEVGLVLGTGILGLGHYYFWIGTPTYWLYTHGTQWTVSHGSCSAFCCSFWTYSTG